MLIFDGVGVHQWKTFMFGCTVPLSDQLCPFLIHTSSFAKTSSASIPFFCLLFFLHVLPQPPSSLLWKLITNGQFENGVRSPPRPLTCQTKNGTRTKRRPSCSRKRRDERTHNKFPSVHTHTKKKRDGRTWGTWIFNISPSAFISQVSTKQRWIIAVTWC